MTNFPEWFTKVTAGKKPFPYQERLATSADFPSFLNVPTGVGKTPAIVLSWLWRRCEMKDKEMPRRLVYCLPMRTLVEQTNSEVKKWIENAKLKDLVEVHILMGGAVSKRWDENPEKNMILIGTQDQLISRALNRGYGMSRYRWPMDFALLNNDCLWVMDEVQLMGIGVKATVQLQAFREHFQTYGNAKSLWMSATLDEELLTTIDYKPNRDKKECLNDEDKEKEELKERLNARKRLVKAQTVCSGKEKEDIAYAKKLAAEVIAAHVPDSLTIVICNRVKRAQEVFKEIQKIYKGENDDLKLIHSRFRSKERKKLNELLSKDKEKLKGILVATQVIEAGVDISAKTMFTELAPWSSFVQRVGRCNRYGEHEKDAEGTVYWIDFDLASKDAAIPYDSTELQLAQELINQLTDKVGNVGPKSIEEFLNGLPEEKKPKLKVEGLIPRKHDLLQLFDTSTDLAGHDIDVSAFIREADNNDVAIAWRNWEGDTPPNDKDDPNYQGALQRDELCNVRINQARAFLKTRTAWRFDSLKGEWKKVKADDIYPGMNLLLRCSEGGYSEELGFTGGTEKPNSVFKPENKTALDTDKGDPLSHNYPEFVELSDHLQDVFKEAEKICDSLLYPDLPIEIIKRAALWHDVGKIHPEFQKMLTKDYPEKREKKNVYWAKSAKKEKNQQDDKKEDLSKDKEKFRYVRHELVSAILALQQNEDFLLAYLVACHHGKVRMTIQPRPGEVAPKDVELYALGVHQNEEIAEVNLGDEVSIKTQKLNLKYMLLGENEETGESWNGRSIALLEKYGPFKLAFLETLVRIADWRGSAKRNDNVMENNDD